MTTEPRTEGLDTTATYTADDMVRHAEALASARAATAFAAGRAAALGDGPMNDDERAAETGRLLRQKRLEQFGPGLDIIEELRTRVGDRMAAAMLAIEAEAARLALEDVAERVRAERRTAPWPQFGAFHPESARDGFNMAIDVVLDAIKEAQDAASVQHGDHPRDSYRYDGCPGCELLRAPALLATKEDGS